MDDTTLVSKVYRVTNVVVPTGGDQFILAGAARDQNQYTVFGEYFLLSSADDGAVTGFRCFSDHNFFPEADGKNAVTQIFEFARARALFDVNGLLKRAGESASGLAIGQKPVIEECAWADIAAHYMIGGLNQDALADLRNRTRLPQVYAQISSMFNRSMLQFEKATLRDSN